MKLPYGKSNFRSVIVENNYYVDKTKYIEYLEDSDSDYVFLLRPRRFGKSLFVSMLEYYYGIQHKDEFEKLFGKLYIGKNPTPKVNSYLVLSFEFSGIDTKTYEKTVEGFLHKVVSGITTFLSNYAQFFTLEDKKEILAQQASNLMIGKLFTKCQEQKITNPICVLIDEYDHFANELLAFRLDKFIDSVTENGFVRKFYETIKTATYEGVVQRFFGTGVTPITLDSMTSGFNITSNISLDYIFNNALGFSQGDVIEILNNISKTRGKIDLDFDKLLPDLKKWYDGYIFNKDAEERIYNPDMILYFAKEFSKTRLKKYPDQIIDTNIASDYSKIQKLFNVKEQDQNYKVLNEIILEGKVKSRLTAEFSLQKEFERKDFVSLLYYMGYISIKSEHLGIYEFSIPNFVIKSLFYDYFAQLVKQKSEIPLSGIDINEKVLELADNNNITPFIELIENTLKGLSNRDFIDFDEKHIKLLFVTFANAAGFYYVKSEPEINQTYPDVMFLWRPPYFPKYQFIFELKYLKKKEAGKLEETHKKAKEQLKDYMQNKEMQDFIVRAEGGMETVKAYTVVFVGEKAEMVEEL